MSWLLLQMLSLIILAKVAEGCGTWHFIFSAGSFVALTGRQNYQQWIEIRAIHKSSRGLSPRTRQRHFWSGCSASAGLVRQQRNGHRGFQWRRTTGPGGGRYRRRPDTLAHYHLSQCHSIHR